MSIRKSYTDLIFSRIKLLEFRNKIGKEVNPGDKIFVYETKRGTGSGSVIGSVTIDSIIQIPHHRVGTYFILPYYVEQFGTEEDRAAVHKAMQVDLLDCDNSLVLSYLFDDYVLDHMLEFRQPVDPWEALCESLYTGKAYLEIEKKTKNLNNDCDAWAKLIGYYDEDDISYWKYAIKLKNPVKFDKGKNIAEFRGRDERYLQKAPQSWCYTIN